MSRFPLLFAAARIFILLVAMAAIAEASTKTITTTTSIEENPRLSRTEVICARRMIWQEMLSHCRLYLNFEGRNQNMNIAPEHLQFCCMQLANMGDEECMCDGIHTMAFIQGWTQPEMGEMLTMAQLLPKQCNLMSQECQIREAGHIVLNIIKAI